MARRHHPARGSRPARRRRAQVLTAALSLSALLVLSGGCTSVPAGPDATVPVVHVGPTSPSRPATPPLSAEATSSPGAPPARSTTSADPTATASGFTPVVDAVTCVLERPSDPLVTVGELWPGMLRGGAGTRGLVRFDGPGCADPTAVSDSCVGALAWRPGSGRALLLRSGAQRWLEGRVMADLPAGAVGAQADDTSLDYSALLFTDASGDGATAALESAAVSCLGARLGRVGGRAALVGSVPSVREPGTRAVVAVVSSPGGVVTLRFDGGGWDAAERDRAAAAVLPLLPTP